MQIMKPLPDLAAATPSITRGPQLAHAGPVAGATAPGRGDLVNYWKFLGDA